jgi:superoxide reductase
MTELIPGTSDGAHEKHVPVGEADGSKIIVKVGEVEHPMMENHFIQYIILETDKGFMLKELTPSDKPCAEFVLADGEKAVAAYEYCNLHGLWKTEV